jgi:HAMP domain-containing protein
MDEIERLEIRIEGIREAIARSRRLRRVGLASAVLGPALIVGFVLGLVDYSPTRVIVAFALAIGGMVLMGSSRSSTEELEQAMRQVEAQRMAAIDALNLVEVGEQVNRGGERLEQPEV